MVTLRGCSVLLFVAFIAKTTSSSIKSNFFKWKNNLNIHYIQEGIDGPNLLLIPGFGVGTFHYERNIKELSKNFRVFSFDLLGQGLSWPENGIVKSEDQLCYSVETWIEQTIYFIENVIRNSTHIAGNSLGGYISVATTTKRPQLVKSAILLNPTPFWGFNGDDYFLWNGVLPAPKPLLKFGSSYFDVLRNRKTVETMLSGVYASRDGYDDNLIKSIIESASRPGGQDAFTSILFAPKLRQSFDDMLAEVQVPLCLIMGKEDPWIVPYWGQRLKRIQPTTLYFELSPTGHCPHHESPSAVNAIIKKWLSTIDIAPGDADADNQDDVESSNIPLRFLGEFQSELYRDILGAYEEEHGTRVEVTMTDGKPRNIVEHVGALLDGTSNLKSDKNP